MACFRRFVESGRVIGCSGANPGKVAIPSNQHRITRFHVSVAGLRALPSCCPMSFDPAMTPPTNPKEQKLQTLHIDEGLVLYRRRKSRYWWCRTTQNGRTHRSSTKTDNRGDATKFAQKWVEKFDNVNYSYALPSIQEQQKIIQYLDQKTQQIDSLIEKKQKEIELLKEQRTSLINQVLTKGLNPDEGVDSN